MKIIVTIITIILLSLLIFDKQSYAHPGRTDSNGGHYCWTNCAKWGLQYGEYHYHNGGGSSGGSNSAPQYDPEKEYSKGYKIGYNKGFSMGYKEDYNSVEYTYTNEDYKRGWDEGYDKGWNDGLFRKQEEEKIIEEKEQGKYDGLIEGEAAFLNGEEINTYTTTTYISNYYKNAYQAAFKEGWTIGSLKKKYYDLGYQLGLKQDKMQLTSFTKNNTYLPQFKEGFNSGVKVRENKIINEQSNIGFQDGLNLRKMEPKNTSKPIYMDAYKKAYLKGENSKKKQVTKNGYEFAFHSVNLSVPTEFKTQKELLEWYSNGFNSNKMAKEIKKVAYENGKSVFHLNDEIPKKYVEGKEIYRILYNKGKKIRNNHVHIAEMSGVVIGFSGGSYIIYKRRRKKAS